jgi:hypothetical protein
VRVNSKIATVLLLTIILFANVAAAKKKRENAPLDPRLAAIQSITILPTVDLRSGKKASVNLTKIGKRAANDLKHKNYPAVLADSTGAVGEIVEEDLTQPKADWIKRLGPPSDRWIMVVCLFDVYSKITFGSTGNAELSGYLFDKETGEVIWSGKGVGQAGQGGLAGMTFKGMMKGAALDAAVYNLLGSVPKRPKPGK